ncbi:PadR family transcriptional regulator [Piscinibacter terrae]|uniref:PadR family transcriptional regulator n=1 Tax=Piscinibacter terrae TaxID=2496871 RepID=A0A3N7HPM5_9BURK|nr:PadR family transcriptional regulator [Albitalea terrae]RQP24168.1 PadR family transcriptional regulator [Albitalea terrae]
MHDFLRRCGFDLPHHHHRHGHRHDHHFGRHGRHGHGFGFGRHGGFGGDASMAGFGAGRKISSGDLQLLILALLAEKPRHGYELIKELDERSKGFYVPSPGMVYPALSYLEETGLASVDAEGTKKLYSVTVAGLSHLDEHRAAVDAMLQQLAWIGARMERVRDAFGSEDEAGFDPRGRGRRGFIDELHDAIHAVRSAIREVGDEADQRRVAEILRRAIEEIRRGRKEGA